MSGKLHAHLRSNVVGYVAIFLFAVGGTAYATHPGGANTVSSGDIINGQVLTQDIGTGNVMNSDIAANSVPSSKIVDGTVQGADLGTGSVGTDEISNFTIKANDIDNDQVSAIHIADGGISAGDVSNVFEAGYGSDVACFDDDEDGEACASTTLTLNQPGTLLVNATGEWRTSSNSEAVAQMDCVLQVDGVDMGLEQSMGEAGLNHTLNQNGTMALTALSPDLNTGSHTVQTFCTQINDDIDLLHNQITAARVDGG